MSSQTKQVKEDGVEFCPFPIRKHCLAFRNLKVFGVETRQKHITHNIW